MEHDAIDIREFAEDDLEAVVAFSLRAWEPVFASVQAVLGDEIFLRLHPDWRTSQERTVRSICTNDERDVYVAVPAHDLSASSPSPRIVPRADGRHRDHRSRPRLSAAGSRRPTHRVRAAHMRRCGMDIAVVETGGDPGHVPARALYGDAGFTACRSPVTSGCSTDGQLGATVLCARSWPTIAEPSHAAVSPPNPRAHTAGVRRGP